MVFHIFPGEMDFIDIAEFNDDMVERLLVSHRRITERDMILLFLIWPQEHLQLYWKY